MKKIATQFDPSTGLFSLAEAIPSGALRIEYGEPETTVYESVAELPPPEKAADVVVDVPITDRLEALAARLKAIDGQDEATVEELVVGDNPDTPEVEKSWWRKSLGVVGIKV